MRILLLAALVCSGLGLTACSAGPADCGQGAKLVGELCRPLCTAETQCLSSETCSEGACVPRVPGPIGEDSGVTPFRDASEQPRLDAEITPDPDAGMPEPRDADPIPTQDAETFPDAEPPLPNDGGRRLPDLRVQANASVPSPVLVDEGFALAVTMRNAGQGAAGASQIGLFLNPAGVQDYVPGTSIPIGALNVQGLVAGSMRTVSVPATVPRTISPGTYTAIVVIDTMGTINESDERNNVEVLGPIDVVTIAVEPERIDFGRVPAPCGEGSESLAIVNRGTTSVTIRSITLSAGSAFEARAPMTPFTLTGNQQIAFNVVFRPRVPGQAAATLDVEHDQAGSPTQIPLTGQGVSGSQTITIAPPHARTADILIVIDERATGPLATLAMRAGDVIADLGAANVDYRIGVISAQDQGMRTGALRGPPFVITPMTPDPAGALAQNLQPSATSPIDPNIGFTAIRAALTGVQGTTFLRDGAALLVVSVSETDDASVGEEPGSIAAFLRALKGDVPGIAVASAIVPTTACTVLFPATRYEALAQQTGGTVAPVCDSMRWDAVLSPGVGSRFGMPYRFDLPSAPDLATLMVRVGGAPVSAMAYVYDAMRNAVRLSGSALPAPNETVEISYTPVCP